MFSYMDKFFIVPKIVSKVFWFLYCLFYDFWSFSFSNLDLNRKKIKNKEYVMYNNYSQYKLKKHYVDYVYFYNFLTMDYIWAKYMSYNYLLNNSKINLFSSYFRVLSVNQGFYFNFMNLKNRKFFLNMLKTTFLSGFSYCWSAMKFWVFPLLVSFCIIYVTLVLKALPFNKIMLAWISMMMFLYWLISGFVFFF